MRALVRPSTMSLSLLLAGSLAPLAAQAQPAPDQQYQPQPGYQQPQGYPEQPGYQQPQQYPQQQYQQPQQYPQQQYQQPQQYPQQQYQQPQPYPPPGYAPQAPPPGYYAPPPQPAYGQQPTYAPPPAYAPPPPAGPPAYRRGFLLMPYLGVNVPVGDTSNGMSTGLRLGGLMGAMVGPFVSLNGELTIDILNPDTPSGMSVTEVEADLAFSPLFHLSLPGLELVAGPKIGFFALSGSVSYSSSTYSDTTYSGSGVAYGFNTGVFIPIVGRLAIGGLLGYTVRSFSSCDSGSTDCVSGPDEKFFSFTGAMIF